MKTTNLKWIAYALSALMLMQSCTVYQKNLSSIDVAIVTQKKKIMITKANQTYNVRSLEKVDDKIILFAGSNSILARKMYSYVTEIYPDSKQVKLEIPLHIIKGFYLKDLTLSRIITYGLIFIPIIFLVIAILYYNNSNYLL